MKKIIIDLKNKIFLHKGNFYGYADKGLVYIFTENKSYIESVSNFRIRCKSSDPYECSNVVVYNSDYWKELYNIAGSKKICLIKDYPDHPVDIVLPDRNSIDKFFELIKS
jgi:hypothetical protein